MRWYNYRSNGRYFVRVVMGALASEACTSTEMYGGALPQHSDDYIGLPPGTGSMEVLPQDAELYKKLMCGRMRPMQYGGGSIPTGVD